MSDDDKMTKTKVLTDFGDAHEAKRALIEEERQDVLFAVGKQWDDKDVAELKQKGVKAITDNRIRTNIFLLTGLERQNRSEFRAFPEGDEDSIHATVASALFKNVVKQSDGEFKFSEMFEDGITSGESYLELYLDSTYNMLNPKPLWRKMNFDQIYPEPGWKEYDLSDASYVYKFMAGIKKGDLISLFPEKKAKIEKLTDGLINTGKLLKPSGAHIQERDYPERSTVDLSSDKKSKGKFDLLERYYKKWVERTFILDKIEGDLLESRPDDEDKRSSEDVAKDFVRKALKRDPNQKDRFAIIKKTVPEIWYAAMTGGMESLLADEVAWFYPRWKSWPFTPYFAHWINTPLPPEDAHLAIQGIVRGSKVSQMDHNKRKTQWLRIMDTSANSGWLTPKDAWTDRKKVESFGSTPGVNLEYDPQKGVPSRITPSTLSEAHVFSSQDAAESIKQQMGIKPDLLATPERGAESGRAIALRERQGIVMVQKLYDNLSRTKKIAGKFLMSQFSEIFDKKGARRVLGEAFLRKHFSREVVNPQTGQADKVFDEQSLDEANQVIGKVFNDVNLGKYDVAVGETVMSETMRKAEFDEIKEFIGLFPQLIPPQVIIEESTLPSGVKSRIISAVEKAQSQAAAQAQAQAAPAQAAPAQGGSDLPPIKV